MKKEYNEVCKFCDKDCKQRVDVKLEYCPHAIEVYNKLLIEAKETGVNKYQVWLNNHPEATKVDCARYFGVNYKQVKRYVM